jgi:hypothetical protein
MSRLFQGLDIAGFRARAEEASDGLTLALSGTADLRAQEALDGFLKDADQHVRDGGAREVIVDLQQLEFMNSSCFKAFVSWIGRLQELPQDRQYKIRFRADQRMLWQRRSLHALACFAVDLIKIEGG